MVVFEQQHVTLMGLFFPATKDDLIPQFGADDFDEIVGQDDLKLFEGTQSARSFGNASLRVQGFGQLGLRVAPHFQGAKTDRQGGTSWGLFVGPGLHGHDGASATQLVLISYMHDTCFATEKGDERKVPRRVFLASSAARARMLHGGELDFQTIVRLEAFVGI